MTNATEINTAELTTEQRTLAAQLNERVKSLELQGSLAVFAQARDLREIRDSELYRALEMPSGGFYPNFGTYIQTVTTKQPPTISQNISVVTAFSEYSDEQLAKAGPEKLDIARKMMGEGYYSNTDDALAAAIKHSRSDLLDIRRSQGGTQTITVALSARKVTKFQAVRMEETFQKYAAIYAQAHGEAAEAPTDSQITDFVLDVWAGLPNDFLLEAASGEGGAAPEMADGYTPKDVPLAEVIYYVAESAMESGRDPQEILDQLSVGFQSIKDRFAIQQQEREEQAKAQAKAEREAGKAQEKWVKKLQAAKPGQILVMGDGAKAEVMDTSADNGEGVQGIFLKGIQDGTELVFSDKGEQYAITEIASKGVTALEKAPPAPKEKKVAAPKAKKEKAEEPAAEESKLGMSKAQQAGRKPKKAAAKKADDGDN